MNEKEIVEIEVWDRTGNKFTFGQNYGVDYREVTKVWDDNYKETFRHYHSSWYLTRVTSVNAKDIIDL